MVFVEIYINPIEMPNSKCHYIKVNTTTKKVYVSNWTP